MYSLIIVDYNSVEATMAYISRCREAMGIQGAGHIVLVENGTNEGVPEQLSREYGPYTRQQMPGVAQQLYCFGQGDWQLCYCHSGKNMGYARGNNLGIRIADALWKDAFYIISNNDLVFEKPLELSAADALFASHPEVGVVGPRILGPRGEDQSPRFWQGAFHRLVINTWVGAAGAVLSEAAYSKLSDRWCNDTVSHAQTGPCAWVSGCFMLIRAEAFHAAGMFDENTFLYAEEMILSRRMEAVGSTVWFCRELEVIHNHAQTTKKALSVFRMRQIDFDSNWYYYKTYANTSAMTLLLAKWNFALYKRVFHLWQRIKK